MGVNAENVALMLPGHALWRSDYTSGRPWNATVPVHNQRYADGISRRHRVLNVATWLVVCISAAFGIVGLVTGIGLWRVVITSFIPAVIFALTPLLHRFGELVAPLGFFTCAYVAISLTCWLTGTGWGQEFYFLAVATLVVLVFGIEHIVLASVLVAVAAGLAISLKILVHTGVQPAPTVTLGLIFSVVGSCVVVAATVLFALREIARAEQALELEYQRSKSLLDNILPAGIAERLKTPTAGIIADKYDDASILFADIAGFTQWASDNTPAELVRFLNQLYTSLDRLVDQHGLEKVKTTGDCYMVVSGVPSPRRDHLEALASLALDLAATVAGLHDPQGRPIPLRIGLAAGPVVAGVVGARRFFYDVWGDAVNVASRMESTAAEGRIQVPRGVYERLQQAFTFEERGEVDVKGKGVMHTWYLMGRRTADG
jgi:adenylate cyclase